MLMGARVILACRSPTKAKAVSHLYLSINHSVCYVDTLITYRHVVFKLEKIYAKALRTNRGTCHPPPTPYGWNIITDDD